MIQTGISLKCTIVIVAMKTIMFVMVISLHRKQPKRSLAKEWINGIFTYRYNTSV